MSADPAPPARHPLAVRTVVLITLAGVIVDQATKLLVLRVLEPGVFVPLLGDAVGWQLVFNPGAAFGISVPTPLFLVVATLVVVVVVSSVRHTTSLVQVTAYGLLLAGAAGNLIDRVVRAEDGFLSGEVVDFVAWGTFPRFNVADSCITVGFALLVVALVLEERRGARQRAAAGADGDAVESDDASPGHADDASHDDLDER